MAMEGDGSERAESILIIDDEVGIREGCRRVLEPLGYRVELAATLQEGLVQIETSSFDIFLLDVMMPDGRGLDLLPSIQANDPDAIVIIITGYATVELAVDAIRAGAYDFIAKPFSPDLLLISINKGLERRRLYQAAQRLRAVEEEQAEMARVQEEARRLSEFKTAFTFKVAHELRAPVAGAISLMRPLMRGLAGELSEQQRDILARIDNRLSVLMELVNDLLDLATTKTMVAEEPLEAVALVPAIQEVIDRLSAEAYAKAITLTLEERAAGLVVKATERGLVTVFSNLIGNAVKYTPEAGRVQVRIGKEEDQALITISDTGIGIPADDLPKVGHEFFRAGNALQSSIIGTGLGLSIVGELIGKYGGSLDIRSVEGKGTTVDIRLPIHEREG